MNWVLQNSFPMTPLMGAAIVLLLGTLWALSALVIHGAYAERAETRREGRLRAARAPLVRGSLGDTGIDETVAALGGLSPDDLIALFNQVGRTLSGRERQRLGRIAERLGLTERARRWCRSRRWWRRLHGVRLFHVLSGGETVVPGLLTDASDDVRREVVRWTSAHAREADIRRLLTLADRTELIDDLALIDALVRAGPVAMPPIQSYLEAPGPAIIPVLIAIEARADPALAPAIGPLTRHAESGVRLAAARVLGEIATPELQQTLATLLEDTVPEVRRSAVEAIARGRDWRSAPLLKGRLGDVDPRVRQAAALALRDLGSPGILLLREAARSGDEQVRRVARYVLDSPETRSGGGA